ncbi:MAG: DUF1259 domain-containing protein [Chloroflexota bacterium]|nr:DUF1259 domain-containing protein [Chloroflexota bacterium]
MDEQKKPISRRDVLITGAGLAGVGAVASLVGSHPTSAHAQEAIFSGSSTSLPVKQIEDIMEATGTVSNGVLTIDLDRDDLHVVGPGGIPFKPAWEINGEFFFQPLSNGQAILNGDMCLLPEETNPFIDKLFQGGITLMAFHQHFFDLHPMVFFQHFRGIGDPLQLARAAINAVKVTGTPLPQKAPSNPTTPLPAEELAHILGGTAMIGGSGVVTVSIPRAETIYLAGVALKPETGVSVTVAFEPLDSSGQYAAVAPDYALIASEVNPALAVARAEGFVVHCLYNQETAEQPQLYFSHNLKTGNPVDLAWQIYKVLDKMNVKRS